MTSANFRTVAVSDIVIDRSVRQRRELKNIEQLAASIKVAGLINPPVVDKNMNLVAGERRLTACIKLGWTSIPVQFAEDLPPDQLYLIELEENVKRDDLSWQDNCLAIENYHNMRAKMSPKWNFTSTAMALGMSQNDVSERHLVALALIEGDPMVLAADKYSVARGLVQRKRERASASAVEKLKAMSGTTAPSIKTVQLSEEEMAELAADGPGDSFITEALERAASVIPFVHADFHDWVKTYSGPKFNFIHCDFPYGVDAGNHNQGAAKAFGGYDDGEDVYWQLLYTLSEAMSNVVDSSAHCMFWFSMDYYAGTKARLEEMGWTVNPFPLIWHKSDNSGILPDPKRGPRRIYETAFLCSRSDRFIVRSVSNVYSAPNTKLIHMSEKNPEMLEHFFRMFVDDSTLMLDPTMGSGQAVRVAERMGAHMVCGLERSEEFYSRAKQAYIEGLTNGGEAV
jgi:ParB/RepB/Spo0J family partition protein